MLPEPTPSPRLWATAPGATPTRLCEHTMRVSSRPWPVTSPNGGWSRDYGRELVAEFFSPCTHTLETVLLISFFVGCCTLIQVGLPPPQ